MCSGFGTTLFAASADALDPTFDCAEMIDIAAPGIPKTLWLGVDGQVMEGVGVALTRGAASESDSAVANFMKGELDVTALC